MSLTLWLTFSFTAIFIALYIVGFIKKIPVLYNISSAFILPLAGLANLYILKDYLPDSTHIMILTTAAYASLIFSQILFIFDKYRKARFFATSFHLITIIIWIQLYISATYIYRVPAITAVIFAIIFVLLCAALCIFCGKQRLYSYVYVILEFASGGFLCFLAFTFLVYTKKTNAILLNAGTLMNIAFIVYYSLDKFKYQFKLGKPFILLLIIAAQALISYSNILMLQ